MELRLFCRLHPDKHGLKGATHLGLDTLVQLSLQF